MLANSDRRIFFTIRLNSMLQKPDWQLTHRFPGSSIPDTLKMKG